MATAQPNRITVPLDEDTMALLRELEGLTGLSPAQIVGKLIPSHLEELWEYLTWLKSLPPGPSKRRSLGVHLVHNYGPDDLIQGLKRLDPTYQTEGDRFKAQLSEQEAKG